MSVDAEAIRRRYRGTGQIEALCDEVVRRGRELAERDAEIERLRGVVLKLISCVLTVSKVHTEEWMAYIPESINEAATAIGETDRAALHGNRRELVIVRGESNRS
jgi:hypothetical protein